MAQAPICKWADRRLYAWQKEYYRRNLFHVDEQELVGTSQDETHLLLNQHKTPMSGV